jgi:hypothetical protein
VNPEPVVCNTASDVVSNGAVPEGKDFSEERMTKPKAERKSRKAVSKRARKRRKGQSHGSGSSSRPGTMVAFRLSARDEKLLDGDGTEDRSARLRHLLVTHFLLANQNVTSVTFYGGYCASKVSDKENEWVVTDKRGKELTTIDREKAILRAEWWAQVATNTVPKRIPTRDKDGKRRKVALVKPPKDRRLGRTKAFRLSDDEREAMEKLAELNGTNLSVVLRSFLTTQFERHHHRLVEMRFGKNYRAYPSASGWCIEELPSEQKVSCEIKQLKEVFERIEWLMQTRSSTTAA